MRADAESCISFDSYIKPQPDKIFERGESSCISFDSYIKPQPWVTGYDSHFVVYLLIPTSNHNLRIKFLSLFKLYIF